VVAIFLVARSIPRALQDAPIRAAVAPRLALVVRPPLMRAVTTEV